MTVTFPENDKDSIYKNDDVYIDENGAKYGE